MTRLLAPLLMFLCGALLGQSEEPLRFEAASIKPSADPSSGHSGTDSDTGRLAITNRTLKECIMTAYAVAPNLIAGGPPWLDSDRFDIVAKAEGPAQKPELMKMLQSLLADRFQLRFHRETRNLPALVLEVAKGGSKLERATGEGSSTNNGRGRIEARGATMAHFVEVLSRQTEVPVVDRTGLEGRYNLKLEWTRDQDAATGAGTGPSLFTAVGEQLGLRLRSEKAPLQVLVIDRAEKPSEN
jgi:uncharacterized protein (TIGR03435 family)